MCGCIDLLPSGFLVVLVAMSPPQYVWMCFSLLGLGPKMFVLCVLCIDLLPSGFLVILLAISPRQVVSVCFSLSSCDPLRVCESCAVVLTCCHLAFWSYWWLCRLPNVCGCVSVC